MRTGTLGPDERAEALAAMAERELDILVVGGGVVGAGVVGDGVCGEQLPFDTLSPVLAPTV